MNTRHAQMSQSALTGTRLSPAWIILIAGIVSALHVGKVPPALPILQRELGLSLVQAGFLISLVQIASMLVGLAVGLAVAGWGYRRSVLIGLALLALASLAGSFATTATALLSLRALEGFGFLLVVMPGPSLMRRLVTPQRVNTMVAFWSVYMPFGSATAMLTGPWVISYAGWPAWWMVLALVTAAMCLWVYLAVPADPRATPSASSDSKTHTLAKPPSENWRHRLAMTLKAPGPWAVALSFAVYAGQWFAVIGFLPSIYAEAGISGGLSGVLTALAAGINMVGCIGSGRLLASGVRPYNLLYTGFSTMAACVLIAFADIGGYTAPPMVQYVAILVFSAIGGYIPGTLFTLAVRLAPSESTISTTVGWMQQWSATGQLFIPPLAGWVATVTGGWSWTWTICLVCGVIGVLLARLIFHLVQKPH